MDYILTVSYLPESIIKDIGLVSDIKDNKYGTPTAYLGANIEPFQMSAGKYAWIIKCSSYGAADVQTIKEFLSKEDRELKSGNRPHKGPLPHEYNTNLDVRDKFYAKHMYWFQKIIEIF